MPARLAFANNPSWLLLKLVLNCLPSAEGGDTTAHIPRVQRRGKGMASNSPSEQQVWTLAHQLLLSTQEGLLCHMEVLITFAGASWHPTRPLPARSAYSPAPGAHAWARWGAPHCCPYKSPLPEKVVKLKDIETVHYQIKNRVPLI